MRGDHKRLGGVYQILNKVDGRSYVGSARYMKRRFAQHRHAMRNGLPANVPLAKAWAQFGEACFEFRVLEIVEDPSRLFERENFWIAQIKSADPEFGYNVARTAESNKGFKMTAEQRAALSVARRGRRIKPETIQKIVAKTIGQKRTPETRARMRIAQKLRFDTERFMVATFVCAHLRYNPTLAIAN